MSLCIIVCLTGAMHCESVEVQTGETQLQVWQSPTIRKGIEQK
jgi:hypothetical protein